MPLLLITEEEMSIIQKGLTELTIQWELRKSSIIKFLEASFLRTLVMIMRSVMKKKKSFRIEQSETLLLFAALLLSSSTKFGSSSVKNPKTRVLPTKIACYGKYTSTILGLISVSCAKGWNKQAIIPQNGYRLSFMKLHIWKTKWLHGRAGLHIEIAE